MVTTQQRDIMFFDFAEKTDGRLQTFGNNETTDIKSTKLSNVFFSLARILPTQIVKVTEFGGAKDLKTIWVEVFRISGQSQAGLLNSWNLYKTAQTTLARQKLQVKPGLRLGQ